MKRCPTCNSTFDDEYLSYCTTDGTVLVRDEVSASLELQETALFGEPPPTVVMPPPRPTEYVAQAPNAPTPPAPYGWANESPPAWVPPPPPVPFRGITRPAQQGTGGRLVNLWDSLALPLDGFVADRYSACSRWCWERWR